VLALFAVVYWPQANDTNPADALEVLYALPIALLALRFGLRVREGRRRTTW
jgi:hypothetical protein